MTLKRMNSGSFTDITTRKRRVTGSWMDIDLVRRRSTGTWTIVFQSINIADQAIYRVSATATTAGYRVNTSGISEKREGATYTTLETWLTSGYTASNYEVRATLLSGDALTSGTVGSWLALSSSREWRQQVPGGSSGIVWSSNLLIEIRNATTGVVVDTANVSLTSEGL